MKKGQIFILLLFFFAIFLQATAFAAGTGPSEFDQQAFLLTHFGASDSQSFSEQIQKWDSAQTLRGFETILRYMDPPKSELDLPGQQLARYAIWNNEELIVYKDRDTKQIVDFRVRLKQQNSDADRPEDRDGLIADFRTLSAQAKSGAKLPLLGLRIAIDPGHMGGLIWDKRTGKWVRAGRFYVSEGTIALQTSLLLAHELLELGASVVLTRHSRSAVSTEDFETFNINPYAQMELRSQATSPWFLGFLEKNVTSWQDLNESLIAKFKAEPAVKLLFSDQARTTYFTNRADLAARAKIINEFRPHLTLIIHFDANKNLGWQTKDHAIRGYIHGNVFETELATAEQRYTTVRALLDGHRWMQSLLFTTTLVKNISATTDIPLLLTDKDYGAIKIANGVYARNLALSRQIEHGATAYLELAHYNYKDELRELSFNDKSADVFGIRFRYSRRLDDFVEGVKNGVLDFILNFQ